MIFLNVVIIGNNLESSKYYFNVINPEQNFISKGLGSFTISTKLIRISGLRNTALNLNGASIGRKITLKIHNLAIEEFINSSLDMKTIGLNLLRQEIINHFRI